MTLRTPFAPPEQNKTIPAYRPTKPRSYGTTESVVARSYIEAGGPKRVAALLGRKASQVHAYADPDTTAQISFEQARTLTRQGASAFVEDLCAAAGGAFLPPFTGGGTLHGLVARSAVEHGELVARVLNATADGRIGEGERAEILRDLDDTIRALVEARATLNAGGAQ